MTLPPVIGITIANPAFMDMAAHAAASFRKYTGAPALILAVDDGGLAHAWKYSLPQIAGDRVLCFFDADTRFVAPVDLSQFANLNGIAAVKDPSRHCLTSFCLHDAMALDFDPDTYCNTGLFFANPRRPAVQEAFDLAACMMTDQQAGRGPDLKDVTEQSILNAAWHRAGVDLQFLDDSWNFWPHAIARGWLAKRPETLKVVHAAGITGARRKSELLDNYASVLEFERPLPIATQA